ncbi:MAG: VCBS repeat-containing protein, partial [Planctomycetaceae bacterium]|nr:VCBS repeat-containing protein [Planctomycetaceae bacterium]
MKKQYLWLAGLLLVTIVLFLLFRPPAPRPNGHGAGAAQQSELQADFQRAVGLLENGDHAEAAKLFAQLHEQLPGNIPVLTNLALAYLLPLETEVDPGEQQRLRSELQPALAELGKLAESGTQPDAIVPWHLFAARLAKLHGEPELALKHLELAAQAAPGDAAFAYEAAQVAFASGTENLQASGLASLEQAHEIAPQNLWVLGELLLRQVEQDSPQLKETLAAAIESCQVVRESVRSHSRVDIVELLTAAQTALDEGNPAILLRNIRIVQNVLRPEDAAQSDKIRLEKHPLEFVALHLFTGDDVPPVPYTPALSFDLESVALPDEAAQGILDIAVADFDLDGRDDLWLLSDEQLILLSPSNEDGEWQVAHQFAIPAGYQHLVLADLDLDAREAPTGTEVRAQQGVSCHLADFDAVLFGEAGATLLKNVLNTETGLRTLEQVPLSREANAVVAATVVDVDIDGDLDLLLARASGGIEQWSNRNDWNFGLVADSPASLPEGVVFQQFAPVDLDRDVDLDVLVASPDGTCGVLENLRHGLLRFQPLLVDGKPLSATCVDVLELNADASWDLIAATGDGTIGYVSVTTPEGKLTFREHRNCGPTTDRFLLADFDNSGDEELVK